MDEGRELSATSRGYDRRSLLRQLHVEAYSLGCFKAYFLVVFCWLGYFYITSKPKEYILVSQVSLNSILQCCEASQGYFMLCSGTSSCARQEGRRFANAHVLQMIVESFFARVVTSHHECGSRLFTGGSPRYSVVARASSRAFATVPGARGTV